MRRQALPYVLVAMVIGLFAGCGGGASTCSTRPDPDVTAAKKDLLLAYRVANKARLDGLRCSVGSSPGCHHPRWYPSAGALVAEIGAEKLHRLTAELATSMDQVAKTGVTYILSDKTRRK